MVSDNTTANIITTLIFLPTKLRKVKSAYLHGEMEVRDNTVTVYITQLSMKSCKRCLGVYSAEESDNDFEKSDSWIHLERRDDQIALKKYKLQGECICLSGLGVVLIYYDHDIFMQCDHSLLIEGTGVAKRDHFTSLIDKLNSTKKENESVYDPFKKPLQYIRYLIVVLSYISKKLFFITKCSSIGFHINNYLDGLLWLTESKKGSRREHIKKLNFLLSVVLDIYLGCVFLQYLTTQFSSDPFPEFLLTTWKAVQSLRDLIHWLTGDPAGFKLNFTFSKMLATFFLFYIDIWCAFIAILRPLYKIIFMVFLIIGKAGITFQVSVMADVLAVVTFHIYCICLFAARLYNIQVFALIALWRLFLGRKWNPLRGWVDSCKYTPEQLFIGTLGFTILLFLLPTTFIYYIVFTFTIYMPKTILGMTFVDKIFPFYFLMWEEYSLLRIILTSVNESLGRTRYFILSLQPYSTMLWLFRSPKVCAGIRLNPIKPRCAPDDNTFAFQAMPVCTSWSETVVHDKAEFLEKPDDIHILDIFYSLLVGTVKNSR